MISVNFFVRKKTLTTANIAKSRLKIIFPKHSVKNKLTSHKLINLKNDLIQVVRKHMNEPKDILMQFKKKDENTSVLECNFLFLNKDI